ncbi:MAG: 2-oxoisovalerate dehydrogenase [Chloroflexota bacterium]|nr:2-oxoisovalerate dehydrogenase [Chloroflexota bacterium]
MLDEVVFEVHEAEEGSYYSAAIGHDIITQCDTWEELKSMAQEAVLCHFDDGEVPGTLRLRPARES